MDLDNFAQEIDCCIDCRELSCLHDCLNKCNGIRSEKNINDLDQVKLYYFEANIHAAIASLEGGSLESKYEELNFNEMVSALDRA